MKPVGWVLLAAVSGAVAAEAPATGSLLGPGYVVEARASFPAGLYHWIDSLAGTSNGKTVDAYRSEYRARFGEVDPASRRAIEDFVAARAAHVRARRADGVADPSVPAISALLGTFCAAKQLDDALASMAGTVGAEDVARMRSALDRMRPKYEEVWENGRVVREFLDRVKRDPARDELAATLVKVARFFDVDPSTTAPPSIALVPVPDGFGTHAEAVGRHLLLEIRPGDGLADQAAVVAHENTHFLYGLIPPDRRARLESHAGRAGAKGQRVWELLKESIPTAVGQGIVDRGFRPAIWSREAPWYHTSEVDAYAKTLYGLVNHYLASGKRFDEAFIDEAFARLPEPGQEGRDRRPAGLTDVTPRSP